MTINSAEKVYDSKTGNKPKLKVCNLFFPLLFGFGHMPEFGIKQFSD